MEGITLIGVAKGRRSAGRPGNNCFLVVRAGHAHYTAAGLTRIASDSTVRDEAHRISRLQGIAENGPNVISQSILETIRVRAQSNGAKLLKQFGGLQGILRAGIDDLLIQIRGLGPDTLAQVIYEHLHPGPLGLISIGICRNTLTWLRILMIPGVVILFYSPFWWAHPAAGVGLHWRELPTTLDGYFARKLGLTIAARCVFRSRRRQIDSRGCTGADCQRGSTMVHRDTWQA